MVTEERVEEVTVRLRGGDGGGSAEMSTYYVKIITSSIKHINLITMVLSDLLIPKALTCPLHSTVVPL